ncbi:hypothetical protein [Streptomyces sp. V4I2]|uniref:hypothetical protein n=1 Tax=Streptomyces sp. V4I2 TaxID=3042280 RepID=UPI0027D88125|nr:hypothetical protein [Streptomyces sp. V4I2]
MVSAPRQPESLGDYLYRHLNLPLDFEGPFTVKHLADVAVLATAHSAGYAATQHMVSLMAGIPVPTERNDEREGFWFKFWQASGTAYFMPANMKHSVVAALDGDGTSLADRFLTGLSEMSPEQWAATASVVGTALEGRLSPLKEPERNGELWLRDVQLTAWRVLYADHAPLGWEERMAFREEWKSV